jgi:preprotein translocase subunit SecA
MLSNAIEQAQKTVESRNFQVRKSVLEYDDVINVQRNIIYEQRRKVLDGEDIKSYVRTMINDVIRSSVTAAMAEYERITDRRQLEEILSPFEKLFLPKGAIKPAGDELNALTAESLSDLILERAETAYEAKEKHMGNLPDGTPLMRELERVIMLRVVDEYWMDHIDAMHELRRGIGLRAYGNTKPVDAYKQEGFDMFEAMVNGIKEEVVRRIFTVQVRKEQPLERKSVARGAVGSVGGDATVKKQPVRKEKKPGRNDPCPCGKMKPDGSRRLKYKECCGRNV